MLNLIIASIVTVFVAYCVVKRYKAQAILLLGGIILMACSVPLVGKPILAGKASTGYIWFDIFKYITTLFESRTAGLGMIIMAVGGFTRYMDKVGASNELVRICIKPLKLFHAPYIMLGISYIIGQILNIFIPSASGLGMLLMLTMYPILVSLGVSKAGATATIATAACLDLGPASGNATLAAKNSGMDVAKYFAEYQIPVAICVMLTIAIAHMLVQQYYDKKDGHIAIKAELGVTEGEQAAPRIYALLPILPLFLILTFSQLFIKHIDMDVITAMLISLTVSMVLEYIRHRDFKAVLASIQVFFDGMAAQFAAVITLIVAGEVFAKGLTSIGAIETVIKAAQTAGFGGYAMTVVMTAVIVVSAILMGSGNAPFFAFAALAPSVASKVDMAPVLMLLPMQFASGIARNMSPITAVVVAVAGIAGVSPIEVVKRSVIPMALALIATLVGTFTVLH